MRLSNPFARSCWLKWALASPCHSLPIRFVMSHVPTPELPNECFFKFDIGSFAKICGNLQFGLTSGNNDGHRILRPKHVSSRSWNVTRQMFIYRSKECVQQRLPAKIKHALFPLHVYWKSCIFRDKREGGKMWTSILYRYVSFLFPVHRSQCSVLWSTVSTP